MNEIRFFDILKVDDSIKEKIRQWRNSDRVNACMLNQHTITNEEHSKWIAGLRNNKHKKNWVIFMGAIPIGAIYLEKMDYEKLTSEWGFYIGDDNYIGKGFANPILFKFLEIFFDQIKFKTLLIKVLPCNIIALNLYRKFGFKKIRGLHFKENKDVIFLKFTRKDWLNTKFKLLNEDTRVQIMIEKA